MPSSAKIRIGAYRAGPGAGNEGSANAAFNAAAMALMTTAPTTPQSTDDTTAPWRHHAVPSRAARSSQATPTTSAADMPASVSSTGVDPFRRIDPAFNVQNPAGLMASRATTKNRMCTASRTPTHVRGISSNRTSASTPAGRIETR
ncbi:hypothetical protein D9M72_546720 [compost metagenome]